MFDIINSGLSGHLVAPSLTSALTPATRCAPAWFGFLLMKVRARVLAAVMGELKGCAAVEGESLCERREERSSAGDLLGPCGAREGCEGEGGLMLEPPWIPCFVLQDEISGL